MKCQKCKRDFSNVIWEKGKTYEGLDEHHNPPKFMIEKWNGKTYYLCRKHHRELHDEIIKILNKFTKSSVFVKSERWTWIKIIPKDRLKVTKEVCNFTERWINDT